MAHTRSGEKEARVETGAGKGERGIRGHLGNPFKAMRAHKDVTGRVLLVLLVLVLTLVPALFVNNIIGYLPLLLFVLVIGVSYAYLRVLMRSLEYSEESLVSSCERGTAIEFTVNFRNKSFLPFLRMDASFYISDLFGDLDVVMPASLPLMPHEERDFSFDARFDHIGTYSAGVQQIVISDLLGLFRHTIVNPNRHEVEVLPRVFDVSRVDLSNVSVQESSKAFQPIVTDDMDYAGVREYQWGDPLKTIHWKLSSRMPEGEYYTRLFETFGNPGLGIIVDSTSPEYDAESLMYVFDGLVESALSVNEFAHDNGMESDIIYNDKHGERCVQRLLNVKESGALVSSMPRIRVAEGRDALELFTREVNANHGHGNVALCTAHATDEMVSSLIEAKLYKRNPLLFMVVPKHMENDELKELLRPLRRLDAAGIVYYIVSSAEDLGVNGEDAR